MRRDRADGDAGGRRGVAPESRGLTREPGSRTKRRSCHSRHWTKRRRSRKPRDCFHLGMSLSECFAQKVTWLDARNSIFPTNDQVLKKPNRDGKDWRGFYKSLPSFGFPATSQISQEVSRAHSTVVERFIDQIHQILKGSSMTLCRVWQEQTIKPNEIFNCKQESCRSKNRQISPKKKPASAHLQDCGLRSLPGSLDPFSHGHA